MRLDEPVFAYLSHSSRASMGSVREVLERWFVEVPNSHADGIRARIQSGDDEQFESAYWEMYVATLLRRRGYQLTWEPDIPGTTRHPDFLVERGEDVFYVEARTIGSKKIGLAERRRTTKAYESIRAWDVPDFFLGLTLEVVGATDLRIADFKKAVGSWLAGLDPDAVLATQAQATLFEVPYETVRTGGWAITVHAMPRKPDARGSGQETLGGYSTSVGGRLDNDERILVAVQDKASRYGNALPHPLVLAVLANTEFATSIEQVASALWGRWYWDDQGVIHLDHLQLPNRPAFKGFWRTVAGRRYRRVQGVLVGRFIHPWNLGDELPTLWTASHADPNAPLDLGVAVWEEVNELVTYRQAEHSALQALGLPEDWMTPDEEIPQ